MTLAPSAKAINSRMLAAGFALGGGLIALYLALYSFGLSPLVCPITGCETVQSSPYSKLFGVPVALYGLGWFGLVTGVAVAGLWIDRVGAWRLQVVLIGLSAVDLLAYLPLTALELFVIKAICFWCVISSLMMLGALGSSWYGRQE